MESKHLFKHVFKNVKIENYKCSTENTTIYLPSDYEADTDKLMTHTNPTGQNAVGSVTPGVFSMEYLDYWNYGQQSEGVEVFNISESQKDTLNKVISKYTDWENLTKEDSDYKSMRVALDLIASMENTIKRLTEICDSLYQDAGSRSTKEGGHPLYPGS